MSTTPSGRILRNISALGLGQIFTWLTTLGIVALMPRYLGDENLGRLAAAISLTDLAGLAAALGITNYLTKEIARKGIDGHTDVANALATRLPLTVLATVLAIVSAWMLGYDEQLLTVVYLLCINIALTSVGGVLLGALQGMQEMRPVAFVGALSKGLYLGLVAIALFGGHGLEGVALASVIASAVTVAGYLIPLVRAGAIRGPVDVRTFRGIIIGSLPFFTWQAALMIYGQVDVILLKQMTWDAVVGWYVAAYRIVGIPVFVPVIIAAAVFPALSQSAVHGGAHFKALARRSIHTVILLTTPMALGIMVLAEPILGFLHYPEEFRNSIPLIMILALHIPLVGADMIIGNVLNARDRQRPWALTGVAAAVLNPTLNFLLIPVFDRAYGNGAIGAASATVITEVFMMVMGLWLLHGAVFGRSTAMHAGKSLAASFVMAGAVWLTRDVFLLIPIAIGVMVYGVSSLVLGTISANDLADLRGLLSRRMATRAAAA